MPSLPHRPVLAHRDGTSSFASLHNSDVYYSNDEIAVLYDVVSAAQGNLNHLPEGERLATNALFQAYDTVLPLHGIDPEEDHHISRLVFRVGGERGDAGARNRNSFKLTKERKLSPPNPSLLFPALNPSCTWLKACSKTLQRAISEGI
ncbi:hypothetical protein CTRI78_v012123 [Colletotrichum trifolii]|uniref:Uncharacterized protein n=1 Tax=Colletotrichum trifolii TaxID=5466 RepID=A0A4R8Q3A4_COLTR|nr:hypothetical protein CTRI78_v012123 [Colletotrichum trifolii]